MLEPLLARARNYFESGQRLENGHLWTMASYRYAMALAVLQGMLDLHESGQMTMDQETEAAAFQLTQLVISSMNALHGKMGNGHNLSASKSDVPVGSILDTLIEEAEALL